MKFNIAVFAPGAIAPYRFLDIYNFTVNEDEGFLEFEYKPEDGITSRARFAFTGYILEEVDPSFIREMDDEQAVEEIAIA